MLLRVDIEDCHNGVRHFLGFFETPEAALEAINDDLDERLASGQEFGVTWSMRDRDGQPADVELTWDETDEAFVVRPTRDAPTLSVGVLNVPETELPAN